MSSAMWCSSAVPSLEPGVPVRLGWCRSRRPRMSAAGVGWALIREGFRAQREGW